MLINDNTKGQSGAKERDRLDAMLAVGNEFMTSSDESSTIQRSGEFVRIDMEDEEVQTISRFLLLHETSDQYDAEGVLLDDADFYALAPEQKLRQRTRLYLSRLDTGTGRDTAFSPVRSALETVRMPRFTQRTEAPFPRKLWGMHERCYTAIAGKRRLFPMPDGKVMVVRDVVERGGRFFYGGQRASMSRTRSARVSRVEVVPLDPERGKLSAPIFSFPVHSGLGVDVTGKVLNNSRIIGPSLPISDATYVFSATAGACWGCDLYTSASSNVPFGGDAGDLYAVCEPATAKAPNGKPYLSLLAVYAGDDDVRDAASSGPYRLTCKRTTPEGDTVTGKITFQALPAHPNHYLAARGITLLRTGPSTAVLRVFVHAMQSGVPGTLGANVGDVMYFWTQDNGATWTYQPVVIGFPGDQPYGAMLVRDTNTALVFSSMPDTPFAAVAVWALTPAGFSQVGSIPLVTFREGLSTNNLVPYLASGFGGVVYRKTPEGVKKRLWMQFDPRWVYKRESAWVLDYPGSRPMLMTSDDGGVTWSRRLLPTPWGFLAGFVVSVDGSTLAVPVYGARQEVDQPVRATVYLSKDGGATWKPSRVSVTLPGETRSDGNVVIGRQIGSGPYQRMDQDISDCWLEYNRGELHPMLVLRDLKGNPMRSNPARPWMVDATVEKPSYG